HGVFSGRDDDLRDTFGEFLYLVVIDLSHIHCNHAGDGQPALFFGNDKVFHRKDVGKHLRIGEIKEDPEDFTEPVPSSEPVHRSRSFSMRNSSCFLMRRVTSSSFWISFKKYFMSVERWYAKKFRPPFFNPSSMVNVHTGSFTVCSV